MIDTGIGMCIFLEAIHIDVKKRVFYFTDKSEDYHQKLYFFCCFFGSQRRYLIVIDRSRDLSISLVESRRESKQISTNAKSKQNVSHTRESRSSPCESSQRQLVPNSTRVFKRKMHRAGPIISSPDDGSAASPARPDNPVDEPDYPVLISWQLDAAERNSFDTIVRAASGRGLLCHSERIRANWDKYRDAFDADWPTTRTPSYTEIERRTLRTWRNWHRDTFYLVELPQIARLAHLLFLVMHLYREEDNWPMPFTVDLLIQATEWSNAVGFTKLQAHVRPELCERMGSNRLEATVKIYLMSKRIPEDEELNRAIDQFFEDRRKLEAEESQRGVALRLARLGVAHKNMNGYGHNLGRGDRTHRALTISRFMKEVTKKRKMKKKFCLSVCAGYMGGSDRFTKYFGWSELNNYLQRFFLYQISKIYSRRFDSKIEYFQICSDESPSLKLKM
ncbi:unnamed protein product [Trichogramma brassicae]|uniref:Uncharacterized protein n=1 Tax=Trichogramma brassicae TaxID=86971 RepID=A0A6H5IP06_9HYME|nr:unnamed protein product [Trichogramma brassicae]